MEWANVDNRTKSQSSASGGYYGANRGPMRTYRWYWRRPSLPFSAPECHGHKCTHIRRDSWRCQSCAARISPERLHHRLVAVFGATPFGRQGNSLRRVFQVNTYVSPWGKRVTGFTSWVAATPGARLAERTWKSISR
jgi:hypothetical protein